MFEAIKVTKINEEQKFVIMRKSFVLSFDIKDENYKFREITEAMSGFQPSIGMVAFKESDTTKIINHLNHAVEIGIEIDDIDLESLIHFAVSSKEYLEEFEKLVRQGELH